MNLLLVRHSTRVLPHYNIFSDDVETIIKSLLGGYVHASYIHALIF